MRAQASKIQDEVRTVKKRRLSPQTLALLKRAGRQARELGHSYVGTEHILLSLLHDESRPAALALRRLGWEERAFRGLLLAEKGRGNAGLPLLQGLSPRASMVVAGACREAAQLHDESVEPEHLLLAMAREPACTACAMLLESGADLNCVFSDAYFSLQRPSCAQTVGRETNTKLMEQYCENMLEKAGQMEPVIGREREIDAVMEILSRKNKNNPALIGEPGVGKTAIVEGLAQRLSRGQAPESLRGKRLYALDMAGMLAGTKYRGEFEERVRDMLQEIRRCGNIVLFVDEMHTLVGAGSAEGAIDAANLLKPALGRGEVQMIGATTTEEYRKYIEKDAALERRFRPVVVREPSKQETGLILRGLRPGLERHHRLRITDEAIDAAVELSCRYLTDRFLPDKALDLLDEGAARVWLAGSRGTDAGFERERQAAEDELDRAVRESRFEQAAVLRDRLQSLLRRQAEIARGRRGRAVTADDIAGTVAERTGVPAGKLTLSEKDRLLGLRAEISARVIGQQEAVDAAVRAILRGRAGLADADRPTASLLFMGPSGVGKTELCKALADCVFGSRDALIRLDMTEYMEPNSVSRLLGAPPGYIGHDEGGTLTEKVRRRPYSVVLFDELEKAHRDVTGVLLQILEDGILTDSLGRTVDFKNTVIVMTSNIGGGRADRAGLGFTPGPDAERAKSLLRSYFSVEFLGRIDCAAVFKKLSAEDLEKIAGLQLQKTAERARQQGLRLILEPSAARCLAQLCQREDSGARSLRHKIQTLVEQPLAEYLLADDRAAAFAVRADGDRLLVEKTETDGK
jgi:ATP-dependent Clp protease ATP-binding subunit ClpC